ncbi:50S ribosomal protein L3 [bacterium]|nr:50S ribosomal protein L3 [bacterium]MCK4325351.1 50S ribosomal protein L3 [bacterium]MCK4437068.1 50S ribosomal protein L3 [bacterium]
MMGLIGKKIGMTQVFEESGEVIPATILETGPCSIVQKKTRAGDGYEALQLGFESKKESRINKPLKGHFLKAGVKPKRVIREIKVDNLDDYQAGDEIKVDIFKAGDWVDVKGISKGRGFSGVMKRWGFSGGPASHGAHKSHRRVGAIGMSSPRLFKGKKMPGRMGGRQVTCQNLKVVRVDLAGNLLTVKGAVPGANGGYLLIRKAIKK